MKKGKTQKKKSYDQRLKLLRQQASIRSINRAENYSKAVWEVINNVRNKEKRTELKLLIIEFYYYVVIDQVLYRSSESHVQVNWIGEWNYIEIQIINLYE
ncbi:hypothetical protein J6590_016196 [Homalodisca vitripennis]|nr:hypothetical protein J6590_016196 [Homalodisca vitripennis]